MLWLIYRRGLNQGEGKSFIRTVLLYRCEIATAMKSSSWHENAATDQPRIHKYGEHQMSNLLFTFTFAFNSIAINVAEPAFSSAFVCGTFPLFC